MIILLRRSWRLAAKHPLRIYLDAPSEKVDASGQKVILPLARIPHIKSEFRLRAEKKADFTMLIILSIPFITLTSDALPSEKASP